MQNAKDSFYMALRTRLAAINPERTVLLRGTIRPGILVEEAEARVRDLRADQGERVEEPVHALGRVEPADIRDGEWIDLPV